MSFRNCAALMFTCLCASVRRDADWRDFYIQVQESWCWLYFSILQTRFLDVYVYLASSWYVLFEWKINLRVSDWSAWWWWWLFSHFFELVLMSLKKFSWLSCKLIHSGNREKCVITKLFVKGLTLTILNSTLSACLLAQSRNFPHYYPFAKIAELWVLPRAIYIHDLQRYD